MHVTDSTGLQPIGLGGSLHIQGVNPQPEPATAGPGAPTPPATIRDIARSVLGLRRLVDVLREAQGGTPTRGPATVVSHASLQLHVGASDAEQPDAPAFDPADPALDGASTAAVAIGGAYDGSLGTGTLTFEVTSGGTAGVSSIALEVRDDEGEVVATLVLDPDDASGAPAETVGGLTVELAPGLAVEGESFAVSLTSPEPEEPAVVVPEPREPGAHDPADELAASSFAFGGRRVPVLASDGLRALVAAASASAERVSPERVPIEGPPIGSPTGDLDRPMAEVPRLAGVTAGRFTVNGRGIEVDPQTMSLEDVIEAIRDAGAGVRAGYDPRSSRFVLAAKRAGEPIALTTDTSGLLSQLGLDLGVFGGSQGGNPPRPLLGALEQALATLEARLADTLQGLGSTGVLVDLTG